MKQIIIIYKCRMNCLDDVNKLWAPATNSHLPLIMYLFMHMRYKYKLIDKSINFGWVFAFPLNKYDLTFRKRFITIIFGMRVCVRSDRSRSVWSHPSIFSSDGFILAFDHLIWFSYSNPRKHELITENRIIYGFRIVSLLRTKCIDDFNGFG